MAVTVNLQGNANAQGNPYIEEVGTRNSDAVIITSGWTSGSTGASGGGVEYQIRRQDRSPWTMDGQSTMSVYASNSTSELIRAVSQTSLTVVLPFRQWFEARARRGSGAWTAWVAFKTRDKTYKIPDAAFTESRVAQANTTQGATVTVTNVGKSTETASATGTRVVNTDNQSNEVSSIVNTATGVRVTARSTETITATGVRIG